MAKLWKCIVYFVCKCIVLCRHTLLRPLQKQTERKYFVSCLNCRTPLGASEVYTGSMYRVTCLHILFPPFRKYRKTFTHFTTALILIRCMGFCMGFSLLLQHTQTEKKLLTFNLNNLSYTCRCRCNYLARLAQGERYRSRLCQ